MFFTKDRTALRQVYVNAWQKHQHGLYLEPLERLIAEVIAEHPEYHPALTGDDDTLAKDYRPELGQSNPFLHMGLHIAIREQVSTNRPFGITRIHHQLCQHQQNRHNAEHLMMECLAETLWHSQQENTAPNEIAYLQCLQHLLP